MSGALFFLFAVLLLLFQTAWKHLGPVSATPDLLVGLLVAISMLGRSRKVFLLVLILALLRVALSADPSAFVLAFFALGAFILQEFRHTLFPEKILVQFALAFFVSCAFFTLGDLAAGVVSFPRREAFGSGLVTALLSPLLFLALRRLSAFRPLLDPR